MCVCVCTWNGLELTLLVFNRRLAIENGTYYLQVLGLYLGFIP